MDVIDGFMAATSNMAAPPVFRLWSAISLVSSLASRRVWTCIEDDLPLYPNTYIWLVGPPAIGKSRPMDLVSSIYTAFDGIALTGDEVTREEMVWHMSTTFTDEVPDGAWSFVINVSEIGTFMPKPDINWMQAIARLWDCPRLYTRRIKSETKGKRGAPEMCHNVYVTMLAGAQPAWFATGFPQHSYDLGLPSRIHFVFADQKPQREFFRDARQATGLDALMPHLECVHAIAGEFAWADQAKAMWRDWAARGMPPVPADTLLRGYAGRRDMHAGKLALISALSAHPRDRLITPRDLQRAWDWLFAVESEAPRALAAAGGNVWNMAQEAILDYVRDRCAATGAPVEERFVRRQLNRMVPAYMVEHIIEELVTQGRLKHLPSSVAPLRRFKPGVG